MHGLIQLVGLGLKIILGPVIILLEMLCKGQNLEHTAVALELPMVLQIRLETYIMIHKHQLAIYTVFV